MNICQVIKYEGPNDVLAWKHPIEDFNTTSQLIVHESQEAILFRDGQALDLFGPGRYTLKTENIPLLRKIVSIVTDGVTPFHCEVYFVNKVDVMDVLWGTSSPMPIEDPKYNIILPVRANGQFGLTVDDSRKFLVKLVGTTEGMGKETLSTYFRGFLMTRIKGYISSMMVQKQISFLEINSYLNEISDELQKQIEILFADYGVKIKNFFVNSITIPEDDPSYLKIKNALAAAKEKQLLATGKRAEMDILGYNYQQERTFNVLDKAAQNEGSGSNIMGAGMGLGMGVNLGSIVGGAMGGAIKNISANTAAPSSSEENIKCSKCGAEIPKGAKFCLECGNKIEPKTDNVICPKCGMSTPKGKFCINCGSRLATNCPKCGAELPGNSKFCPECGEKIGE